MNKVLILAYIIIVINFNRFYRTPKRVFKGNKRTMKRERTSYDRLRPVERLGA